MLLRDKMEEDIENKENDKKEGTEKAAYFEKGGWYARIPRNEKSLKAVNLLAIVVSSALVILFVLLVIFTRAPKLDPPAGLAVSSNGIVSWTAVDNAGGYTVKVSATTGITDITKDVSGTTSFDLTTLDLASGNTYQVSIKAVCEGYTDSDYSVMVSYVV